MDADPWINAWYLIGNSFEVLESLLALCSPRVEVLEKLLSRLLYKFVKGRKIRGTDPESGYELALESFIRIPRILQIELQGFRK